MRSFAALLLTLAVLAPLAHGDETGKLSPKEAWEKMQQDRKAARDAQDWDSYRSIPKDRPKEFLEAWEKSRQTAVGEELFFLGQFYLGADRPVDAMGPFLAGTRVEDASVQAMGRTSFARALAAALSAHKIDDEAADEAIKIVTGFLEMDQADSQRASLHQLLATCHNLRGRKDVAAEHCIKAAQGNPAQTYGLARAGVPAFLEGVVALDQYGPMREKGLNLLAQFVEIQKGYVETLRTQGNEQQLNRAQLYLDRMAGLGKPLEMLGTPAPAWTVEHPFSERKTLADFKGKVVVLDFWATWCPWCIKSFPALRDLLRDYKGKDFTVVGVTVTSGNVWTSRYELDDDFKEKAAGRSTPPALRLPRTASEEDRAAHRAREKEVIAEFMKNHEMTWDVVMIDQSEPATKYAVTGWPQAVVLDREGRVRYFKRGALLRDRPEQVLKFRKVLDQLLAEKK